MAAKSGKAGGSKGGGKKSPARPGRKAAAAKRVVRRAKKSAARIGTRLREAVAAALPGDEPFPIDPPDDDDE